jgi:hypothetical protein
MWPLLVESYSWYCHSLIHLRVTKVSRQEKHYVEMHTGIETNNIALAPWSVTTFQQVIQQCSLWKRTILSLYQYMLNIIQNRKTIQRNKETYNATSASLPVVVISPIWMLAVNRSYFINISNLFDQRCA